VLNADRKQKFRSNQTVQGRFTVEIVIQNEDRRDIRIMTQGEGFNPFPSLLFQFGFNTLLLAGLLFLSIFDVPQFAAGFFIILLFCFIGCPPDHRRQTNIWMNGSGFHEFKATRSSE